MMTITFYDAMMLLIVVVCVIQGAWKGVVWQIAPIASLVLGYVVAYPMSERAAPYFGQPPTNRLFAMIAIYLAVSLAVYLMVRSVRESLEKLKLIEFDRHLGALLGGVKGVLFSIVLTVGLLSVSPQARPMILPSETRTIAARIIGAISPILPAALNDQIGPYVQTLGVVPPLSSFENPFTDHTPAPGFDPMSSSARRDPVIKPPRYDENDGFVPPARDVAPTDPWTQPAARTAPRTQPQQDPYYKPAPGGADDFFNSDPDRPPTRTR